MSPGCWIATAGACWAWPSARASMRVCRRRRCGRPSCAAAAPDPRESNCFITATQGLQYASGPYQDLLAKEGITVSMSRKANCYDNAHMESFWGTLKAEVIAARTFASRAEAGLAIFDYVETFYNRVRLHSALGFHSPVDFEHLTN